MASKPFTAGHILTAADVNDLAGVYDRAASEIDVTNTTTETTLYTKTITGGHLSSDRLLRLTLQGDVLFNNGASNSLSIFVKYGATTLISRGINPAADADRGAFILTVLLANRGATNVQRAVMMWEVGNPTAGADADRFAQAPLRGTAAEDSTADKTLAVTAQWGAASTGLSIRRDYGLLELC